MPGPASSLRILHVAPYSPAAWAYGGIPRVVDGMTEGLAARGHALELWATDACDAVTRLPANAAGHTVAWRILPNVSNRAAYHLQAFAPRGLRQALSTDTHRFDVVHLHACHNLLTARVAQHCTALGLPFVLSPNGTAPVLERRRVLKRAFRFVTRDRALERGAAVLAVTRAEAAALEALGVHERRIRIVPNPVETPRLSRDAAAGFLRARLPDLDGPVVLFLGKVTPRKQLQSLVDAVARLDRSDVHLVIAGSDQGGLRHAVASPSGTHLANRLHVLGTLYGDDRFAALAEADVVAYPSSDEAFGLVPCEALSCGTPVVVGNDAGCAEIVQAVGGGLTVPPGDATALAEALRMVLDFPREWRARAGEAAMAVRQRYSRRHVASELEQIYIDLVARAGRRTA